MKTLILLLAIVLFSSCYTKNQAIKKFCKQDTITTFVVTHDTIRTETIQADTTFADSIDTVVVERDKLVIRYIHKNNKVYLQGECKGDTIYLTKTRTIKVAANYPGIPKPTFWQNVKTYFINGFAFIGLLMAVIFGVRMLIAKLS